MRRGRVLQGDAKRGIYVTIVPLVVLAALVAGVYGLVEPDTALFNWAAPFAMAVVLAAFGWGFARRPDAFAALERGLVATVFGALVVTLLFVTMVAPHEQAENLWTVTRIGFWAPVVIAYGFLALGPRAGSVAAWSLWAVVAAIVASHVARPEGHARSELVALVEMLAAMALAILVLSGFARVARATEKRAAALEAEAHTDALTGLPNRRRAEGALEDEVERSDRYGRPLSVLLFDLDRFKDVNDALGHEAGDRVLSEVRSLLAQRLRDSDVLARWGGEEFLLIAPEMGRAQAARLAERLRRLVELHDFGVGSGLTASFGVAERRVGETAAELVRRADEAMYAAKRDGRNAVRLAGAPGAPATPGPTVGEVP
ncbi:MAG: diguanylate cyclase [Phycisphaerales bacterium JB060]